ncbi:hypothetical protein ColKHC_09489 [Colletotrichum higginsianum]|uniref:Uncharacterized protein n=1 Tax=Colletotrichum higginsianum TaxID=80884 RepID=A0A4T0WJV9_9PEZI|nr:hypothetical protein CH35J_000415 [Colletotrichum higginsianum]GJD00664.1 hypothetical protein ColKHC_09489 [Colletotrichum higginsianum]
MSGNVMLDRRRVSLKIAADGTGHHLGRREGRRLLSLHVASRSGPGSSSVLLLRRADIGLETNLRRRQASLSFLPTTPFALRRSSASKVKRSRGTRSRNFLLCAGRGRLRSSVGLHPSDSSIGEPHFDAARMIAAGQNILDSSGDGAAGGLVGLENDVDARAADDGGYCRDSAHD